ncbi:MAG: hypothetical protein KAW90_04175 [Dehalococcoidales bacterium]|nr:hypothetical protein [Dehalococcoidales bacterium]
MFKLEDSFLSVHHENIKKILTRTAILLLVCILGAATSGFNYTAASADDGPDLIVQAITLSPQDPAIDDTVTITVTVKNQGTDVAALSHVVCYVDSTILDTHSVDSLVAGTSTTTAFTWKAQIGSHTIKAIADPSEIISETDENNNIKTFTMSTLAPDLIVQSITWSPDEPSRGDSIVFTITIRNQGNSRARPSTVHLYIDGNSRGYQDIAGVDPGGTVTRTHNWIAASGQHAIKAVVDETNSVNEGDETNNELTSTFSTLPPDLVIQGITWEPENPSKDDTVTFTVTVKNQGSGRSDLCHLAYFINNEYQSSLAVSSLETGISSNITFTWTALSDAHEVKAIVDYYGNVIESDENNNENTVSLLTAAPDLVVEEITWLPTDAAAGDTVTFTITIKNQGSGRAEESHAACYISGGYQGYLNIAAIEADAEATVTIDWLATTGSHTVSFVVDHDSMLVETYENNNKLTVTIPIIPPDLFIPDITWEPENPAIGETVTFTVTVSNQGGGKADSFYITYYMDDTILALDFIANIESEASANRTCTWKSQNGHHTFTAFVDSKTQVTENNENNNESSVTIAPNMPDLAIGTITWSPADMPAGEEVTYNINIVNQGSLSAGPSRVNYYVDGASVGYADIGQLDAGATVTEQLIWAATTGYHTIEIVTDASNQIFEIEEDNNSKVVTLPPPDLIVEDIAWSPPDASIGDTITFTGTFKNQGSSQTQKAQAACYVDGLPVASVDLPEIESATAVTRTFEWVAEAGLHVIKITADINNRVTETDETNNDKVMNFATLTPDLIIQDISWLMENPLINDDVTFIVTIKNQGSDTASGSQLMYSIDETPGVYQDIEPVPAGDTVIFTFISTLEAGSHTISMAIDANDDVTELEETNNENTLTFSTIAPDLIVKTITWAPLDAIPGDTITVTVKVENRGRDKAVNPRLTLYVDGSPAGYVDIAEIEAGAIATGDISWTVEAGLHEISVLADVDGLVLESNETNNTKSRTLTLEEPEAPVKPAPKLTTSSSSNKGFLGSSWWIILLAAALLGGIAFIAALKSLRNK